MPPKKTIKKRAPRRKSPAKKRAPRRKTRPARLVKGSPEAKAYMSALRDKRKTGPRARLIKAYREQPSRGIIAEPRPDAPYGYFKNGKPRKTPRKIDRSATMTRLEPAEPAVFVPA